MSFILCLPIHMYAHALYLCIYYCIYTFYFCCQRFIFSYRCLNDDAIPSSVPKRTQHDPSQAVYVNIEASEADNVFGTETCLHATSDSVRKDSKVCCVYIFNTLVTISVYIVEYAVCSGVRCMYIYRERGYMYIRCTP